VAQLTYSNKSNAVRGFKRTFPELGLGNTLIRADVLDVAPGRVVINLGAVAELQADVLGQPTFRTNLGIPVLRRSVKPQGAVARCWQMYDALPSGTSRRDAVAKAVDAGIAYNTAATQYQRWSKAKREDARG
jgi:hypothetical protein